MPHSPAVSAFDFVILGGGSAASAAATEARRRGASVAWVETGPAGGTCLNVGCMPSKTLLAAAADRAAAMSGAFAGINTSAGPTDLGALVADKDGFLSSLRHAHISGPPAAGITVFHGLASFAGGTTDGPVAVAIASSDGDRQVITGGEVLIATGSRPLIPNIPGVNDVDYLTSTTAMALDVLPQSLLIIGGNAVGLEQAQLFQRLGAQATVVERAPRIAPLEDSAVSSSLEQALSDEGIRFHTGADLRAVEPSGDGVVAVVVVDGAEERLSGDRILIATGRRPATDDLNLDAVGITTGARGEVIVDDHLRTTHPHIWAAGDVTGHAQYVYVASAQGRVAASNALGGPSGTLDYTALPRVIFTAPAVGSIGLTIAQADTAGIAVEIRELPVAYIPRALVNRRTAGVLMMVSEKTSGRVLGVHMVGDEAGEIITSASYLMSVGVTVQQLGASWAPFLTMGEALKLVALTSPTVRG